MPLLQIDNHALYPCVYDARYKANDMQAHHCSSHGRYSDKGDVIEVNTLLSKLGVQFDSLSSPQGNDKSICSSILSQDA